MFKACSHRMKANAKAKKIKEHSEEIKEKIQTSKKHLHQASASTLRQLCDYTSDTILIEINGLALEYGCSPFLSDSIVFNENSITSIIPDLSQR